MSFPQPVRPALSSGLPVLDPSPSTSWSSAPGRQELSKQDFLSPQASLHFPTWGCRRQVSGLSRPGLRSRCWTQGGSLRPAQSRARHSPSRAPSPHAPTQPHPPTPSLPQSTHLPSPPTTSLQHEHHPPTCAPVLLPARPATHCTGRHPPICPFSSTYVPSVPTPSQLPPPTIYFHAHPGKPLCAHLPATSINPTHHCVLTTHHSPELTHFPTKLKLPSTNVSSPPANHQSQLTLIPARLMAAASDSAHWEAGTPSHRDTHTHAAFTRVPLNFHTLHPRFHTQTRSCDFHATIPLQPHTSTTHFPSRTYPHSAFHIPTLIDKLTPVHTYKAHSASRPHTHNQAPCAHSPSFSHQKATHTWMSQTHQYTKDVCVHVCVRALSPSPAFSSSQLCLIFLQHTKARATSSATRQTESPTVTHRASGGKVKGCPGRGSGENGKRWSRLAPVAMRTAHPWPRGVNRELPPSLGSSAMKRAR